MSGNIYLRR